MLFLPLFARHKPHPFISLPTSTPPPPPPPPPPLLLDSMKYMSICLQAKRKMSGGVPPEIPPPVFLKTSIFCEQKKVSY